MSLEQALDWINDDELVERVGHVTVAQVPGAGAVAEHRHRDVPDRGAALRLDEVLIRTERAFLDAAGLPGRPWYRHLLFAPKPTYAPEVLPGITESLANRDAKQLATQVGRLVAALARASAILEF